MKDNKKFMFEVVPIKFKEYFRNCLYFSLLEWGKTPTEHVSHVLIYLVPLTLLFIKINYKKNFIMKYIMVIKDYTNFSAFTVVKHKSPNTFLKRQKFENVTEIFTKRYTFFFFYLEKRNSQKRLHFASWAVL